MTRVPRIGERCAAAVFFVLAVVFARGGNALAKQSTVVDETGLVPPAVTAQVDARNDQLYGATGEVVVVEVVRGDGGQTTRSDGVALADRVAANRYGAIVWIATGPNQSDLLFAGRALRWVPYDEQLALRRQLSDTVKYCCPGDTMVDLVNQIASAIQVGSKTPPSVGNYVRDRLGELNAEQAATLAQREQRLESATGKGIAVVLFPEPQDAASGALANSIASTMNVSGRIAAVVWVDRAQTASHFAVEQTPGFDTIAPSSLAAINATFESDMQTGRFGDAVVAAVDRTATALEGTSTPMPTLAPEPETPVASPSQSAPSASPSLLQWLPQGGPSPVLTIAFLIFVLAIAILVGYAVRRADRGDG
jgi:uncharacterized membrane protein YgcG